MEEPKYLDSVPSKQHAIVYKTNLEGNNIPRGRGS